MGHLARMQASPFTFCFEKKNTSKLTNIRWYEKNTACIASLIGREWINRSKVSLFFKFAQRVSCSHSLITRKALTHLKFHGQAYRPREYVTKTELFENALHTGGNIIEKDGFTFTCGDKTFWKRWYYDTLVAFMWFPCPFFSNTNPKLPVTVGFYISPA